MNNRPPDQRPQPRETKAMISPEKTYGLSMSDDDLCSECNLCHYKPGELSTCLLPYEANGHEFWPCEFDPDGYVVGCAWFDPKSTTTGELKP